VRFCGRPASLQVVESDGYEIFVCLVLCVSYSYINWRQCDQQASAIYIDLIVPVFSKYFATQLCPTDSNTLYYVKSALTRRVDDVWLMNSVII
jgi:hypothetical protein